MKSNLELLNQNENNTNKNNSKINSNIIFITNNCKNDYTMSYDAEKTCEHCQAKFFSKFNKDRHIDKIHLKKNFKQSLSDQKSRINIEQYKESDKSIENKEVSKSKIIKFIGFKRFTTTILSDYQEKGEKEKNSQQNDDKYDNNNLIDLQNTDPESKASILVEEKTGEFLIASDNKKNNKNIREIITNNFYAILKNNEYYSLGNYFMFKNLIIGNGKYGTVWFGIDFKNARPVAIKTSNEEKRNNALKTEIAIMKKLSKYKIFSKIYKQIILNNRIYLIETLQGPDLYKLRQFSGGKFSIISVYKIGIEILHCLKLIHKDGYLYIDLKDDNVAILSKPITYQKITNNITLIDYGFCEKYNKNENDSPKIHGNVRYSSINALNGNPISRKDDIISFCYLLVDLYIGSLPWKNLSSEYGENEEAIKLKQNYPFKKLCGKGAKELLFIFNDANCLNFDEAPNYDNYIYLMENFIKINTGKSKDDILFDWDKKIIQLIKSFGGIDNLIKNSEEILELFKGYPNFFLKNILEKYMDKK